MSNVVNETIYLPDEAEDVDESVQEAFSKFLASRDKNEITGCVLVSLLTGSNEALSSTVGPLEHKEAVAHYEALEEMGVTPAKLQMSGFFLPGKGIDSFLNNERDASTAT